MQPETEENSELERALLPAWTVIVAVLIIIFASKLHSNRRRLAEVMGIIDWQASSPAKVHPRCTIDTGERLEGWGQPIMAMAPMVGQSDYPFRALCRRHGTTVCWTEMFMASTFATDAGYRIQALGRKGVRADDHPLVVQFAANRPEDFCSAALLAQELGADGVDLNLVIYVLCEPVVGA